MGQQHILFVVENDTGKNNIFLKPPFGFCSAKPTIFFSSLEIRTLNLVSLHTAGFLISVLEADYVYSFYFEFKSSNQVNKIT